MLILVFFLFWFFGNTFELRAATTTVTCTFGHSKYFNQTGTEVWVGKSDSGTLTFRLPVGGLSTSDYTSFYAWNGSWVEAEFTDNGSSATIYTTMSFPDAKDYGLAMYFRNDVGGGDYYCANGVAHVYNMQTPSGVLGDQGTCTYPGDGSGYCSRGPATLGGTTFYGLKYLLAACSRSPVTSGYYFSFDGGPAIDSCSITASSYYYFPLGKTSTEFRMYPTTGAGDWVSANIASVYVYTPGSGSVSPPSPPGPVCDSTCSSVPFGSGGACGVRLTDGSCVVDYGNTIYGLNCCAQVCVPAVGGTCQWTSPCPGGNCDWACGACAPTPTPTTIVPTATPTGAPRNHICDPRFTNRRVSFEVTMTDTGGGETISEMRMRLRRGGSDYLVVRAMNLSTVPTASKWGLAADLATDLSVATSVSGNNRTVVFTVTFDESFTEGLYDIGAWASDGTDDSGWVETGRDFKVWDCKVPVSGTMYDGGEVFDCVASYVDPVTAVSNFSSLVFNGIATEDKTMMVNSPSYGNAGGQELIWGKSYSWTFNSDINVFNLRTRVGDDCLVGASFEIDSGVVNPYADSPTLRVDFAGETIYGHWFQAVGGGILAGSGIRNNVPPTCTGGCVAAMSIGTTVLGVGQSDNGLVGAGVVSNNSGCGDECDYGWPNNWQVSRNMVGKIYTYNSLYNKYFAKLGIGRTYTSGTDMATIETETGGTGLIFVRGDLNVETNNILADDEFLMVVVDGEVNIQEAVSHFDGVIVSDGDITALGSSSEQLKINGMLFAGGDIDLQRTFANNTENNDGPAVVITYNPALIFNMPSSLMRSVTAWREGP